MSQAFTFKRKIISIAIMSTFCMTQNAFAEDASTEKTITAPVVVTATRVEQNSFDLPVAIDVVNQKDIQDGQLQMTLSESLIRVPGITAQNRTQSAQDPQISSRGFGSRSSFGVRGIRLYVDGIPLTMPDGQGQPGVVDLSSIKSIEVMRGPFSALYGNSSGGVIQMLTEDAPKTLEVGGTAMFGSYDTNRQVLDAAGTSENMEYLLNTSNFHTGGYRQNSESDKQAATAKFKFNISDDTKITALVNWFDQSAQDPLGLDRARAFNSNTRESVVPAAIFANTSVKRDHTQIGFNFEQTINDQNKITLVPYIGSRSNAQILTTTATATTKTGVTGTTARLSEIDRDFYGIDAHWDNNGVIGNLPYNLTFGLNYGKQNDVRLDTNILVLGVKSAIKNRDEDNIADNFDQYLQGKLSVLDNVDLHAGVRHTDVTLKVKDRFISGTGSNGNNSGSVEYKKTTPVVGAIWKVTPTFNLYANYGKGFETPTFVEAAFDNVNTGVASKPNLTLKAAQSQNYEIGLKTFIADNTQVNFNIFEIDTKNELVIKQTNLGRSSYTNANDTKRTGAELSVASDFNYGFSTYFSYSLLNAKFDSSFNSAAGLIAAGKIIPGTYKTQIYGEVAWKYVPWGFSTALEGRNNSKVYVDDVNSDSAPGYTIFNIRSGFEQNLASWHLSEYLRVENITDKDYIGSIRVNDSNKLFFEPAAGRNYLLGLSANYKF
jgi:iron complex outermembrane receptor protein